MRRTTENKLKVVAVRVEPAIEQRLRLLAEVTGHKQSFFLQQLIDRGIGGLEEVWLPSAILEQVRSGALQTAPREQGATSDLFGHATDDSEH